MPAWKKAIDSLEYEYQKEDIKKYIQTKEPIKILLLDRENSGVTTLNIWEKKKQKCITVPQDYILPKKLRRVLDIFDARR